MSETRKGTKKKSTSHSKTPGRDRTNNSRNNNRNNPRNNNKNNSRNNNRSNPRNNNSNNSRNNNRNNSRNTNRNNHSNRNRNSRNYQKKEFKRNDPKEKVVVIPVFSSEDEKEEFIANTLFDIMFSLSQDSINKIYIKSQGQAINFCADFVCKLDNRLSNQMFKINKVIKLNSRFFKNNNHRGTRKKSNYPSVLPEESILSYMDVSYNIIK